MDYEKITDLPREKLIELAADYAKGWLAMDGVWFQAVENKRGIDEAVELDIEIWKRFTVMEANRIKSFLGLPDNSGIDGLRRALRFRLYSSLNEDEIEVSGNVLTFRVVSCRVQAARERKGMEFHKCKPVGLGEYDGFAKTIDSRFSTECVSCYPDITEPSCACVWRFTLNCT
jgi:hypothetical protein